MRSELACRLILLCVFSELAGVSYAEQSAAGDATRQWKYPVECTSIESSPTHGKPVECLPFPAAAGVLTDEEVSKLEEHRRRERLWRDSRPERLGVALSGGGTRAASVAMGVLGQLHYSGILSEVDAISSVSGGGYAAYFYFSRLVSLGKNQPLNAFSDMIWRAYTEDIEEKRNDGLRLSKDFRKEWANHFWDRPAFATSTSALTTCDAFDRGENLAKGDKAGGVCCARHAEGDHTRDQLHVSAWRDLLADSTAKPETLAETDQTHKGQWLSELGLLSVLTSIPHNIVNTLLDWRVNASVSRERYRAGIHRTYGVIPSERKDACTPNVAEEKACRTPKNSEEPRLLDLMCMYSDGTVTRNEVARDQAEEVSRRLALLAEKMGFVEIERRWPPLRLSQLAAMQADDVASEKHKARPGVPLWIVNASVGKGGIAVDFASRKRDSFFERNFEFTPFGFGSGELGYVTSAYDEMGSDVPSEGSNTDPEPRSQFTALDAVATSAAFLDPNQQKFGLAAKTIVGAGMHLLNAKWGIDVPNFRVPDWRRAVHRALPFPFYWLDGYLPGTESPFLHLSDGGHASDNLGIYALLRRGVSQIIAVDATFDRDGKLDDVCHLRSDLRRHHQVCLEVDGEACAAEDTKEDSTTLDRVCGKADDVFVVEDLNGKRYRLSPFLMNRPVIKLKASGLDERVVPGGSATIYYLKMAIDLRKWFPEEAGEIPRVRHESEGDPCLAESYACRRFADVMRTCTAPYFINGLPAHRPDGPDGKGPGQPCNVALFQVANWGPGSAKSGWRTDFERKADGEINSCLRPSFPQHETESSTLNGSRRTYYAYRDLGAYLARGLTMKDRKIEIRPWAHNSRPELHEGSCMDGYFPKPLEECVWCKDRRPLA